MKKLLTSFCSLFLLQMLFAIEYFKFGDFWVNDDYIYYGNYEYKLSRKNLYIGKDGWYHYDDKLIIFQASGFERYTHGTLFNFVQPSGDKVTLNYYYMSTLDYEPELFDVPEVTFKASSVLTENLNGKTIKYSPDQLSSYMKSYPEDTYIFDDSEKLGVWDYMHIPWVEGVEGNGIGEKIKADFSEPVRAFTILNGYVDPLHPDYYKKNSRVKKLKVIDTENNKTYYFNLEDIVIEQHFRLEERTQHLEFEIAEVYKGDKYQDTCISGLFGETQKNHISVCDGDDEYTLYDRNAYIQKYYFEQERKSKDNILEIAGTENKILDRPEFKSDERYETKISIEYFIKSQDENLLYKSIIEHCKKNNIDRIIDVTLYKDENLRIYMNSRNDMDMETKKPLKSIDYKITSSIPLFNDEDTITDFSWGKGRTISFKGFYTGRSCYYHFMTGLELTFNFQDGTKIKYKASESDMEKILRHYDVSAWIQYEH